MNMTKTMLALVGAALMTAVGLPAFADPAVTVDSVTEHGAWSTIDVKYTLSGVDPNVEYKMLFEVTADGVTKSVKDASWAKKSNTSYTRTIGTAALFGSARRDAKAKVKVSLLVDQYDLSGGQLWEGGPIWASCNVGATKPEESGYHFWWGDTVGYVRNGSLWDAVDGSKMGYSFSTCPTHGVPVGQLYQAGYIDANSEDGKLKPEYDAARKYLTGDWRMPTSAEIQDLIDKCDRTWTTLNGVSGYIVRGKGDYEDKGIFLPAAGYADKSSLNSPGSNGSYWSSSPGSSGAWSLFFNSGSFTRAGYSRYLGFSVRPVRGFAE